MWLACNCRRWGTCGTKPASAGQSSNCSRRLLISQHTNLALREWNRDVVFLKRIPQRQIDIAADIGQPAGGILNPEPQDVIHRTVAKSDDMTDRRLDAQHAIHRFGGINGDLAHLVRITAIRGAEIDIQPHEFVGMGPVHHLPGDQVFVRDQVFAPVPRVTTLT